MSNNKQQTQSSEGSSFNEEDNYLARILFKTLFASLFDSFDCNKQILAAEKAAAQDPSNKLKHNILTSLYNTCMGNLVNREFYGPLKTSKSIPKFYKDSPQTNQSFDLDMQQLDLITDEILKTNNESETKQKMNELFGGADPNKLEESLKEKPSRAVGFFLARNHQAISVMGQRIQQLLQIDPKTSLEKWYQLSQFSRQQYGSKLSFDNSKDSKPIVLEKDLAQKLNNLIRKECLPEYQLDKWNEGDGAVNEMCFSTCAASVMCSEQIQKCFDKSDGVEFYNCLVTDPDLLDCTTKVIMPNLEIPKK
ncbi:hypothetical protein C9374_003869 [Naegleria lovaniensis]|uniref:Uncharacterized protein n=1 Tax=Naegleria lovaniensis TaxID=51637 RepID=A0AA88KYK3_NAELO|nr:uncharacterized protein C9374_003869 [Naegleria lovaniensis]KAG2394105.1 hypothetical protein C9374_003869 [Naegleria lovaniensis]